MNKNICICISQMTAKAGKEKELISALQALIESTRKEPGCITYELWQDVNNPRSFIMYERFKNQETFDLHLQMPYILHFMENQYSTCVESHWDIDLCIFNRKNSGL
jgi:quinol monooxygenase YgiN